MCIEESVSVIRIQMYQLIGTDPWKTTRILLFAPHRCMVNCNWFLIIELCTSHQKPWFARDECVLVMSYITPIINSWCLIISRFHNTQQRTGFRCFFSTLPLIWCLFCIYVATNWFSVCCFSYTCSNICRGRRVCCILSRSCLSWGLYWNVG